MKSKGFLAGILMLSILCLNQGVSLAGSGAIIINHTDTDISTLPSSCVETIKNNYNIFYGHTSHGSQIISGMQTLQNQNSLFSFNTSGGLTIDETSDDLGAEGDTSWADVTRNYLSSHPETNMVMWSWCGGVSSNSAAGIMAYTSAMNQLEVDYPNVTFVYMTGHLDGSGTEGNLNQMNQLIRDYTISNNKVLFDFADIESYNPDGVNFLSQYANDNNDYDGGNWAVEWCNAHPSDPKCAEISCAHSQSLNCNLKGQAFWNMMGQIEGCGEGAVASGPFTDVYTTHPNFDAINFAYNEGIVEGYADGTYKPNNTINRAEFTKILVESKYTDTEINNCVWSEQFPDVSLSQWYAKYICVARAAGIVDGYPDGTFQPANQIKFTEAAKIIVNTFRLETPTTEQWYQPYVEALENEHAIPVSIITVSQDITRGEMAEIIYRLLEGIVDKESSNFF